MTALALTHKQTILERIAAGEFLRDIARDLGVSPGAISHQLSKDPDYLDARQRGVEDRLAKHYTGMEEASDPFNLARARECWRAASWFAEREFPERWGNMERKPPGQVDMAAFLAELSARMLREKQVNSLPARGDHATNAVQQG